MSEIGLSKRLVPSEVIERPLSYQEREYVAVVIHTIDGEEIEGDLSLPKDARGAAIRPFDFLERDTERLLRLRNAVITSRFGRTKVAALAVNKQAVARMYERASIQA